MKKVFLLAALALSFGATTKSDAQVRINVNIGAPVPVAQQSWYGSDCDYYYLPDQGVYYNVNRRMYIWPNGGGWMSGPALPGSYGGCSWGNSRYYSFRGRSPFMRHDYYRNYYGGRGNGYAYRGDRGYDGRRDGRFGHRGGGRGWDNDRGMRGDNRTWGNDQGGRGDNRNWDNDRDGRGGDRNYGNDGRGYNGNGSGRGGWDRR